MLLYINTQLKPRHFSNTPEKTREMKNNFVPEYFPSTLICRP
ncbi:unknown protein [Cronobacter turicensis z3032]|uniref:Uncharacterized protein n=1 Tax=Cronobacter turicensis (strain DSM 18703 / CCUG 55852 / LMG 23827 / z3032) TaxID=693216 RepID=C9Y565_CROTZ|nr:unknown protein [Cronobacter turicensis z3032]